MYPRYKSTPSHPYVAVFTAPRSLAAVGHRAHTDTTWRWGKQRRVQSQLDSPSSAGGISVRIINANTDQVCDAVVLLRNLDGTKKKRSIDQNNNHIVPQRIASDLTAQASQLTMGFVKQLAGLRLDAIPCHRDRGSTAFSDDRDHPSPREVTSSPTAWRRDVLAH